jgi:hypothetical protein
VRQESRVLSCCWNSRGCTFLAELCHNAICPLENPPGALIASVHTISCNVHSNTTCTFPALPARQQHYC